ncbi:MAG TPA: Rid family hydrolase [Rhodocyclaceae bacterium]|nr:Rid family hydrolase [Rhodocyclaceae bacterium]
MSAFAPVEYARLSPARLSALSDAQRNRLLGLSWVGDSFGDWPGELPVQQVLAPVLGGTENVRGEAWQSSSACHSSEAFGIRYRRDGHVLFGVIDVDEADFPLTAEATPLQRATEEAYRRIFRLLDREGYSNLWRVWNYLADINGASHGLERYRQFNIGRQQAFVGSGRLAEGNVPAACALGVRSGPLTIAFLAGRTPPVPLENPRQVSAYRYPAQYGPRSPVFSRAAMVHLPGQEMLLISGTASIVGHRTVHVGDVAGQTRETVANIEALLAEAGKVSRTGPFTLPELNCRAYIRDAADFPVVRQVVEEALGGAAVVYVEADVCRADLLVEIEAVASHRLEAV